jgi:hypothetical protein
VFQQTTPHAHIIAVAFFMTFAYAGWSAPGAAQHNRTEVAVEGPFKSKKVGTSATDLSGIACQPPVGGQHTDVPQGLSLVVPRDQPVWEARPLLPRIEAANADAKAEGLAVLAAADGTLRILLLFEIR